MKPIEFSWSDPSFLHTLRLTKDKQGVSAALEFDWRHADTHSEALRQTVDRLSGEGRAVYANTRDDRVTLHVFPAGDASALLDTLQQGGLTTGEPCKRELKSSEKEKKENGLKKRFNYLRASAISAVMGLSFMVFQGVFELFKVQTDPGLNDKQKELLKNRGITDVRTGLLYASAYSFKTIYGSGDRTPRFADMMQEMREQLAGQGIAWQEQAPLQALSGLTSGLSRKATDWVTAHPIPIADGVAISGHSSNIIGGWKDLVEDRAVNNGKLSLKDLALNYRFWGGVSSAVGDAVGVIVPEVTPERAAELAQSKSWFTRRIVAPILKNPLGLQGMLGMLDKFPSMIFGFLREREKGYGFTQFTVVARNICFLAGRIFNTRASKKTSRADYIEVIDPLLAMAANTILGEDQDKQARTIQAMAEFLDNKLKSTGLIPGDDHSARETLITHLAEKVESLDRHHGVRALFSPSSAPVVQVAESPGAGTAQPSRSPQPSLKDAAPLSSPSMQPA